MACESILENPLMFANKKPDLDKVAIEYLTYAKKYNATLN